MTLALSAAEITALLNDVFPEAGRSWSIDQLTDDAVTITYATTDSMLRPGGTISGPSQMSVMDLAAYVLVLAVKGRAELAVTSSMHLSFLRRPRLGDLNCEARLLKAGRSLVVVDAVLRCVGDPRPVAHAEVTYSMALVDSSDS